MLTLPPVPELAVGTAVKPTNVDPTRALAWTTLAHVAAIPTQQVDRKFTSGRYHNDDDGRDLAKSACTSCARTRKVLPCQRRATVLALEQAIPKQSCGLSEEVRLEDPPAHHERQRPQASACVDGDP